MFRNKNKLAYVLGVVLVLLFLALTVSTAVGIQNKIKEGRYIGQEVESQNTITVSGQGKVYAKPDLAIINFAVVTERNTVGKSLEVNKEKMNKVIETLKQQGIKKKDIKTTTFNIQPRYEWHETIKEEGERVLAGYEVTQRLEVKLRNLEKVGSIIQEATNAGANRVGNISFTIEDKDKFKKQAKEKAIEEAKSKAQETASQLGISLSKIVNFSENVYSPRPYSDVRMEAMQGKGSPQVEPGQNKVEVNVSITYEIN